jgi:hypothetical protein
MVKGDMFINSSAEGSSFGDIVGFDLRIAMVLLSCDTTILQTRERGASLAVADSVVPRPYFTSMVGNRKVLSGSERGGESDCLFLLIPAELRHS